MFRIETKFINTKTKSSINYKVYRKKYYYLIQLILTSKSVDNLYNIVGTRTSIK